MRGAGTRAPPRNGHLSCRLRANRAATVDGCSWPQAASFDGGSRPEAMNRSYSISLLGWFRLQTLRIQGDAIFNPRS
jgi:hypothetical protein